jgi:choice-of-anchor B domain-containing protein
LKIASAICVIAVVSHLSSPAFSQPITLLGHLNQNHGTTGGVSFAGCWGYVAPDGREYAILGTATGCAIIDITNAALPVEIGHIPGATSLWKEVKTYSHYAYVVADVNGTQGLQIINLANLPTSVALDTTILNLGGFSVAQSHTISIHDGYLYLNGTGSGMLIASLANPRRPQYLGRWTTRYVHDSYTRNDTIFAAAINNGRLDIIDGRVKSSPTLIASIAYPGGGTHNVWTTKDRRYAITTDEIGSTAKTLKVWDLQNLPNVSTTPVATFTATPADIEHNIFIRGDYAYVAWYTAGLRIVNITNPTSPTDAGGYDTSTEPPGSYDGMWACYPFFPSGKIIGSDMQNGLYIFGFTGLAPRRPVSLLEPVTGSTVQSLDSIRFRWSSAADFNADPHYYRIHVYGPGMDTTFRATDTTALLSNLSSLVNGSTYTWKVSTCDEINIVQNPDSSQFTYSSLPVVMASFTATMVNDDVLLEWRTLSEIENVGFEVQRSQSIPTHFTTVPNSFTPGFGTTTDPHDYSFTDTTVFPSLWYYRLRQISLDGSSNLVGPISIDVVSGVGENALPGTFMLRQNYPNPFNPTTTISFGVPVATQVSLELFDVLGRSVGVLVNGFVQRGYHSVGIDASHLASGIYLYRLRAGEFVQTRKMVVSK